MIPLLRVTLAALCFSLSSVGSRAHPKANAEGCVGSVRLPRVLGKVNEGPSECPPDAHFLKHLHDEKLAGSKLRHLGEADSKHQGTIHDSRVIEDKSQPEIDRARRGQSPETDSKHQVASNDSELIERQAHRGIDGVRAKVGAAPDCRHEMAIKFDFASIVRSHLKGTCIEERYQKHYRATFFRAVSHAITPKTTHGWLHHVTFHVPGTHTFGDHRFDAEIRFMFEGQRTIWGQTTPNFTLVIPVEADWSWDAQIHPVLQFLERPQDYREKHDCGWSFKGVTTWIWNGFYCPPYELLTDELFGDAQRALHYSAGHTCSHMFVLSEALVASGRQLPRIRPVVASPRGGAAESIAPEVVVGGALRHRESFTVFSEFETSHRKLAFISVMVAGLFVTIGCYLAVRKYSGIYEIDMRDFVEDNCVKQNVLLSHWLNYFVALGIPWFAYANGSTNAMTGMPYEYILCWYFFMLAHMIHEIIMLYQVGAATQRLTYFRVARNAVMTCLNMIHLELHIQFSIIALMHRSFQGWMSVLVVFLFNIVGQLVLVTFKPTPWLQFKARNFEVLHACYTTRLEVGDVTASRSLKRDDDDDETNVNGFESMVLFLGTVGDLIQFFLAVTFVMRFGSSPVMSGVITITVLFLLNSYIGKNVPTRVLE